MLSKLFFRCLNNQFVFRNFINKFFGLRAKYFRLFSSELLSLYTEVVFELISRHFISDQENNTVPDIFKTAFFDPEEVAGKIHFGRTEIFVNFERSFFVCCCQHCFVGFEWNFWRKSGSCSEYFTSFTKLLELWVTKFRLVLWTVHHVSPKKNFGWVSMFRKLSWTWSLNSRYRWDATFAEKFQLELKRPNKSSKLFKMHFYSSLGNV